MNAKKSNIIMTKSYSFALGIVKTLQVSSIATERICVIKKQILRRGTAVGALIKEAEYAQSKADFINKMNIALKKGNETEYWVNFLKDCDYRDKKVSILLILVLSSQLNFYQVL